jgi:DNA (cytosine-5)-methyltransferase 1
MMIGSVCSGIGAPECAWHPLGWRNAFLSEIAPFPRAVLEHRFPGVPIHGDFTTIKTGQYLPIDLLVGGTPCQSFSVAGLRRGLADERGNLALAFLRLAYRLRPRWIVWENVPGVLSSNGGRDFGAFLGGLVQCGYGFAYRVLDAQYFGVPQRRRRVFVVGYLGDWRPAAAVLFERASLRGNPAPRRKAREVAPTIPCRSTAGGGLGTDFDCDGGLIAYGGNNTSVPIDVAAALNACGTASGRHDFATETFIAHTLRCEGFDASEDGTGRGTPLIPAAVAFDLRGREGGSMPEGPHDTANIRAASGGSSRSYLALRKAVRRLTPRECERLQGFPDDWTLVPYRGKPAADGPRYKALGNSMAVPVMRWIGERIATCEHAMASRPLGDEAVRSAAITPRVNGGNYE